MKKVKKLRFQASCALYDIDPENLDKHKQYNPTSESDICFYRGGCERETVKNHHKKCLVNFIIVETIRISLEFCDYDVLIPSMEKHSKYLNCTGYKHLFRHFAKAGLIQQIKYLIDGNKISDKILAEEIEHGTKNNHICNDVYDYLINYNQSLFNYSLIHDAIHFRRDHLIKLLINHSIVICYTNLQEATEACSEQQNLKVIAYRSSEPLLS